MTLVGFGAVVRLPGDGGGDGVAAYRVGRAVSARYFELVGVRAAHRRLFTADEERPGGPHVAVLDHVFWSRYLGADLGILGQTLDVNNIPYTVIGIRPRTLLHVSIMGLGSSREGTEWGRFDDRVLLFTLALAVLTGCLVGLAPVVFAARTDLVSSLKGGSGDAKPGRRFSARQALVVTQVLLSTVLLLGAGLLVRSLDQLESHDPGFETEHQLLAVLATVPPQAADPREQRRTQLGLYDLARRRLAELPGVRSATLIFQPLAAGYVYRTAVEVPGRADDGVLTDKFLVGRDSFETYDIEILRGRGFNDSDREGGVGAVIVNQAFVERHWPDTEPLGRELGLPAHRGRTAGDRFVVVGIAEDVRHASRRDPPVPVIYLPLSQVMTGSRMTVVVRTAGAPQQLMARVRAEIMTVHPDLALSELGTYDRLAAVDLFIEQLYGNAAKLFSLFGLVVACLGIYSVMSCSVSYRVRELGIRMALGASARDVARLVLREAFLLVMAGALLGVAAALGLAHLLTSLLYGVTATDPRTFLSLPLLLAAVGVGAAWLPAWRAGRLDPKIALLEE